jgi:hypothetical protein
MDFCHENGVDVATPTPNSENDFGTIQSNSHADSNPKTTAPQPFPAIEQLRALGYRDGDRVYLRAIGPNGAQKFEATFPDLPIEQLQALNSQGDGIYFVVNGGGHCDADVAECRSIFFEHDDLEIELQLSLWRSLGLPVPTNQTNTGGKSVHNYWAFRETLEPALWRRLQTDLLEMADADRSIKNPSRVMRLAGFAHQTTGAIATIETNSGILYDAAELRELIPMAVGAAPISAQLTIPPAPIAQPIAPKPGNTPQNRSDLKAWSGAVSCEIPLETALSKTERANLAGVSEGGRDNSMAALARGAIGLERYLQSIGQRYSGSAQDLLESACGACNPPLGRGDIDRIWRSAEKSTNGPTLSPEAIANCCKKYWRETELESAWAAAKSANKKPPKPVPFADDEHQPGFDSTPLTGLCHTTFEMVGDVVVPETIQVSGHLIATAHTDSAEGTDAGLYLEFATQRGHERTWTMPRRMVGDPNLAITELAARGFWYNHDQKRLLVKYIVEMGRDLDAAYTISPRTGWVEGEGGALSFVLHAETIGDEGVRYLDVEPPPNPLLQRVGDHQSWLRTIGAMAAGNSRMIAAVGMGLAPLLLKILGIESGGILLYGASSTGKTTALNVAASVTGERTLSTFNATANGTEAAAEAHSDLPLLLDEMGQCDARGLANTVYMLGNEGGKIRMTKTLAARDSKTWRLLFIGTGEIPLIDHLRSAGISTKGGVEARMPSVPADAGRGLGVFDTIHQFATPQQFSDELKHQALQNRGCVLVAFLERLVLVATDAEWIERQRKRHLAITTKMIGTTLDPDGTVGRVARRFALIQLALELAQNWAVTLFPEGQVEWAVERLFADWIEARGGAGSIDIRQAMDRIKALFVSQEFGARIRHVTREREGQIVQNLLAHNVGGEFLVPTSVFDSEFVRDVDRRLLIAALQKEGWLQTPIGNDTRPTKLRRVPGVDGPQRVFEFHRFWGGEDDESPPVTKPAADPGYAVTNPVTPDRITVAAPVANPGYSSGYKISDPENPDVPTVSAPEKLVTRPIVCNQTPVTPETPAPYSVQPPCNRVTTISIYGEGIENENKKLFSDSDHVDLEPDFDWSVAGAVA